MKDNHKTKLLFLSPENKKTLQSSSLINITSSLVQFDTQANYILFYQNHLYGYFKLIVLKTKKTSYQYWHTCIAKKRLQYFVVPYFKKDIKEIEIDTIPVKNSNHFSTIEYFETKHQQHSQNKLFIRLKYFNNEIILDLFSELFSKGWYQRKIKLTHVIQNAIENLHYQGDEKTNYKRLGEYASLLYDYLFPKDIQNDIFNIKRWEIKSSIFFPWKALLENNKWLGLDKNIRHYYLPPVKNKTKLDHCKVSLMCLCQKYQISPSMKQEFEAIKTMTSLLNQDSLVYLNNKEYVIDTLDVFSFISLWKNYLFKKTNDFTIFHYIGHGQIRNLEKMIINKKNSTDYEENFNLSQSGLIMSNKKNHDFELLTHLDINHLEKTPTVIILSTCVGFGKKTFYSLLNKGTRAIIFCNSNMRSDSLSLFFSSFYWFLFYHRASLSEAMRYAARKNASKDFSWSNIYLIGNGDLRLPAKNELM